MKQKLILFLTMIILCCAKSFGQNDWCGIRYDESKSDHDGVYNFTSSIFGSAFDHTICRIVYVGFQVRRNETVVQYELYHSFSGVEHICLRPSKNIYITDDEGLRLPLKGILVNDKIMSAEQYVKENWGFNASKNPKCYVTLVFEGIINPKISPSFIKVKDPSPNSNAEYPYNLKWKDWDQTELSKMYGFNTKTDNIWFEYDIKNFVEKNNDGICGIYEGKTYKLGCIIENGEYKLINMKDVSAGFWIPSELKAILRPSATQGVFLANWLMNNRSLKTDVYVVFNGLTMEVLINGEKDIYLKMYPSDGNSNIAGGGQNNNGNTGSISPDDFSGGWSGSGFALNKGYLATNYHVVEDASVIKVFGVKGNFNVGYNAKVIISDKVNDLAVLKIEDSRFQGFGAIPYRVKTSMAEVGENCFVLGYPMTMTMGSEVKLTTGVVSARSGFQGDVSLYQISAPIQPGNSGGPCFDNSGNLVGIVNAKHKGAENVSYAIKASYLQNLVESSDVSGLLPQSNTVSGYALQGKVKSIKNFVFYIRCK